MVGTPRLGPADIGALARTRRLIRDLRPDIVETHMSKAGIVGRLAARLEGSPIVVHVYHGHVLAGYYGAAKTWLARCAERTLARSSDHLVAVSARVKADLVKYGIAAPAGITVVEPGLEMGELLHCRDQRGSLRQELGLDAHVPLVGIVGRLARIKNHQTFLEAAAAIAAARPEARVLVVGDGDLRPEIEAGAHRLNLMPRMIFTGWRYDLPRVYSDLDVLAMSSDNEGTPIALIEAMAAGCPVVATNAGGVPDLIDHGTTGLLVPVRDPHGLAEAVLRLLRDEPLARELAASARRHVRVRFSASRFVADMDVLYERLVADRALLRAARPGLRNRRLEGRAIAPDAMGVEEGARG
jgi:glycosyltransferase involved in cell wall biosynthesis